MPAKAQKGQALVELSLIMVFLGGFFLLTFDYARAMNTYLVVVHATREAARTATRENTSTTDIQNAATNAAADFISASALTVTCSQITLSASAGTYTVGSACASPRPVDTAFVVTVSTSFLALVPMVGFAGGTGYGDPIPISHSLVGIVQDEP